MGTLFTVQAIVGLPPSIQDEVCRAFLQVLSINALLIASGLGSLRYVAFFIVLGVIVGVLYLGHLISGKLSENVARNNTAMQRQLKGGVDINANTASSGNSDLRKASVLAPRRKSLEVGLQAVDAMQKHIYGKPMEVVNAIYGNQTTVSGDVSEDSSASGSSSASSSDHRGVDVFDIDSDSSSDAPLQDHRPPQHTYVVPAFDNTINNTSMPTYGQKAQYVTSGPAVAAYNLPNANAELASYPVYIAPPMPSDTYPGVHESVTRTYNDIIEPDTNNAASIGSDVLDDEMFALAASSSDGHSSHGSSSNSSIDSTFAAQFQLNDEDPGEEEDLFAAVSEGESN